MLPNRSAFGNFWRASAPCCDAGTPDVPRRSGIRIAAGASSVVGSSIGRTRRLTDPHGAPIALTKGEYALLTAFLDAPRRPLSREHLLQATRVHEDVFDRSIDVQILRLRRRLESDPSAPSIIRTERGVGYVFALPVEPL
jgi:DNA-binding response OmpR family regulator